MMEVFNAKIALKDVHHVIQVKFVVVVLKITTCSLVHAD